jgi:hypothetical protein
LGRLRGSLANALRPPEETGASKIRNTNQLRSNCRSVVINLMV